MLTPAITAARHQLGEARDLLGDRLQCLRCGHEFKPVETRLGLDSAEGWRPLFQNTGTSPAPALLAHAYRENGFEGGNVEVDPQGRKETIFLPGGEIKPSASYICKKERKRERKKERNYIPFFSPSESQEIQSLSLFKRTHYFFIRRRLFPLLASVSETTSNLPSPQCTTGLCCCPLSAMLWESLRWSFLTDLGGCFSPTRALWLPFTFCSLRREICFHCTPVKKLCLCRH